jgi:hypothetical protein
VFSGFVLGRQDGLERFWGRHELGKSKFVFPALEPCEVDMFRHQTNQVEGDVIVR